MKSWDYVLLIAGALLLVFLSATVPAYAVCWECNSSIWELHYQGYVVSLGDLTQDECEAIRNEIDPQTIPFSELECVEKPVLRERV